MPDDDGDRLSALLGLWASDAAAVDAAAARSRQRWLTSQAESTATLVGSLADIAEAGEAVTLHLGTTSFTGTVVAVGRDFVVVHPAGTAPVAVAIAALRRVGAAGPPPPGQGRTTTGVGAGAGGREAPLGLDLLDVVGLLGADRHTARLHLTGGGSVTGMIRSVGEDLVVVVGEGQDRRPQLVPLAAIEAVGPA